MFFFNDTATTEIYTLSLHDALPILGRVRGRGRAARFRQAGLGKSVAREDRKSTRLNSSHYNISYAVFCLKKYGDNQCERLQLGGGANLARCVFKVISA